MFAWLRLPRLNRPSRIALSTMAVWLPIIFGFFWKLGSLTPGLGPDEIATRETSTKLSTLVSNPVEAPFRLAEYGVLHISHSPWAIRSLAATLSLLFLLAFWRAAVDWFGRLIGGLSTLLMAATTWLSVDGRLADGHVWLLMPVGVLAIFLWLRRTKHTFLVSLVFWLSLGVAAYVPGLLWLELAGVVIARKRLMLIIKELRWAVVAGPLVYLVATGPLIWSLVRNWRNIKPLLLIPAHFGNWLADLRSIGHAFLSLFWQTPSHLSYGVGRWPMLTVLQVILVIFGLLVMWSRARRITVGVSTLLLLAIVGAGLNRDWSLLLLGLPSLTIFEAAGLRYLLIEWRTIFPRNPLARTLANIAIISLVLAQVTLAGYYSFQAWPNLDATKAAYVLK